MSIDATELITYIQSILDTLRKAEGNGFVLKMPVEFELAVINTKKKKGGISIYIADVSGISQKEAISKIKFSFGGV